MRGAKRASQCDWCACYRVVYNWLDTITTDLRSKMSDDRLQFEREKWRDEIQLRRDEHELKKREMSRSGWRSPLVVAIAAAALAAISNGAISFLDARQQRALEFQRTQAQLKLEDQRAEAARILEMIKSGDATAVRNNLQFLIEAGLIENEELIRRLAIYLKTTPDERIPRLPQQIAPGDVPSRRLHVLAVGVGDYQASAIFSLSAPVGDAEAVVANAIRQRGGLYSEVSSFLLTDAEATRSNILRAVEDLNHRASAASGDVALIHFSGHAHQVDEEFFIVPFDAEFNSEAGPTNASFISISELGELLSELIETTFVVLTIDACPGGNYRALETVLPQERLTLVVASLPGQACLDTAAQNHGALTLALLEALAGDGDGDGDGAITVSEFVNYVLQRVPEVTDGKQVPAASLGFDGVILTASDEAPMTNRDLLTGDTE